MAYGGVQWRDLTRVVLNLGVPLLWCW
jgi:hypothetical protein